MESLSHLLEQTIAVLSEHALIAAGGVILLTLLLIFCCMVDAIDCPMDVRPRERSVRRRIRSS